MRLFFDLDKQAFVIGPGTTQELLSIDAKRSPNALIEVQFLRNVTPQELPAGATGVFEVKESGKYDADAIFRAGSWTKSGTGADTIYSFVLDLMTTAGDLLLGVNEPVAITSVDAGGNTFTKNAHGLSNGQKVQFSTDDTLPNGIFANTDYFVVTATTNTFQVSLTSGGSAVDFTSPGTGTHSFRRVDNDSAFVSLMAAMEYVASGKTIESQTFVFKYINDVVRDGDTSIPPVPEDVILNMRAGKVAITNGTDTGTITFDTAFDPGATLSIVLTVSKPSGGGNIFATVIESTVDENGFDYFLSAAVPATGYFLHYHAVQV